MQWRPPSAPGLALVAAIALALLPLQLACNRNVDAYDPAEKVEKPDLSRIFPEAAERQAMGSGNAAPGMPPAPPPAAATAEAGAPLRGVVRIAPGAAANAPQGAVLFVIVRMAGAGGGPPVAVKRFTDPEFPVSFEVGPDDRMIQGMPFTGPFQVTARLDADGNAMTRGESDLAGAADGDRSPGDADVEIVLDAAH